VRRGLEKGGKRPSLDLAPGIEVDLALAGVSAKEKRKDLSTSAEALGNFDLRKDSSERRQKEERKDQVRISADKGVAVGGTTHENSVGVRSA